MCHVFFPRVKLPPKKVLLHVFNIFQWISWLSKIGALHFHDEFRECMTNSLLACSGSLTNKGLYEQWFNHWIAHVLDQSTPRPVPALQPGVFILATCAFCSFWLLKNWWPSKPFTWTEDVVLGSCLSTTRRELGPAGLVGHHLHARHLGRSGTTRRLICCRSRYGFVFPTLMGMGHQTVWLSKNIQKLTSHSTSHVYTNITIQYVYLYV